MTRWPRSKDDALAAQLKDRAGACARAAKVVRPERRGDPLAFAPAAKPRLYTGVRDRTEDELAGLILAAQQRERPARERRSVSGIHAWSVKVVDSPRPV